MTREKSCFIIYLVVTLNILSPWKLCWFLIFGPSEIIDEWPSLIYLFCLAAVSVINHLQSFVKVFRRESQLIKLITFRELRLSQQQHFGPGFFLYFCLVHSLRGFLRALSLKDHLKNFGSDEIWTRGHWVRSENATSVVCSPPLSRKYIIWLDLQSCSK